MIIIHMNIAYVCRIICVKVENECFSFRKMDFSYFCSCFEKEIIMNVNIMKRLCAILVLLVLVTTSAMAQDLIVKQDGETIKGYRTDVGGTAVYYRLEDNDETPILSIPKADVLIIKMQDGTKIVMDDDAPKTIVENDVARDEYVLPFPVEPVADPEAIAKAEIGSLIEFYDGSKGVVFYLDGNGHGLVVSLYQLSEFWQNTSSWYDCIDVEAIPNVKNTSMQMGLGASYCDAAIKQCRLEELPAIQWCRSFGLDWYLPSLGELYELLVVSNHAKGTEGPISRIIKANGGDSIQDYFYYLTCSEDDNTNLYSIIGIGEIVIVKKYYPYPCRAIRMF